MSLDTPALSNFAGLDRARPEGRSRDRDGDVFRGKEGELALPNKRAEEIAISKRTAYLLVTSASVDNQIFA